MPEFILKLSRFIGCHRFGDAIGTNGLNADNNARHFLSSRSFLLYKQGSFVCSSGDRRNSGGRVVVFLAGLSLTGGAELQGGGGIAQAGDLASKVQ